MKLFCDVGLVLLLLGNVAASTFSRAGVSGATRSSQRSPDGSHSSWNLPSIFHAIKKTDTLPPAPEKLSPVTLVGQKLATGTRLSTIILLQGIVTSEATATIASKLKLGPLAPIIAANAVVFVAWQIAIEEGGRSDIFKYMNRHFVFRSDDLRKQRLHTMLLSGFSHMNWDHLASNMLALTVSGEKVTKAMGNRSFSYFYTMAIIASDLFDQLVYKNDAQPKENRIFFFTFPISSLGASGAVSAVMTYCFMKHPRDRTDVSNMLGFKDKLELPAWLIWVLGVIPDLFPQRGSNIGHGAHVGGYLFGACWFLAEDLWKRWKSKRKSNSGRQSKRSPRKKHKGQKRPGFRAQLAWAFRRMGSQCLRLARLVVEELQQVVNMVDRHLEARTEREVEEEVRKERMNEERERLWLKHLLPREEMYWETASAFYNSESKTHLSKTHETAEGKKGEARMGFQNRNIFEEAAHDNCEAASDWE